MRMVRTKRSSQETPATEPPVRFDRARSNSQDGPVSWSSSLPRHWLESSDEQAPSSSRSVESQSSAATTRESVPHPHPLRLVQPAPPAETPPAPLRDYSVQQVLAQPVSVRSAPKPVPKADTPQAHPSSSPQTEVAVRSLYEEPKAIYDEDKLDKTLPRLHLAAYHGDLAEVLTCLTSSGESVHDTVVTRSEAGRMVGGITPLFLAAQRGHYEVVKLLVTSGANPAQPAFVQGTTDICTPGQVAQLNFNMKIALYLARATARGKAESKLLKEEESDLQTARSSLIEPMGSMQLYAEDLSHLTGWGPASPGVEEVIPHGGQELTKMRTISKNLRSVPPEFRR